MSKVMYKKAVIFCNGDLADLSRVRAHVDAGTLIIGCDGGASHALSLGLVPHVVIGDFDSISSKTKRVLNGKGVECIRYPREKDKTDSELAVLLAKERGCRKIIIAAVRGTSTDHFLGNLFLIAKKKYTSLDIKIIDGNEEMVLVRNRIRIDGKKGEIVSLVAIGEKATGVTTRGLFYPLANAVLRSGSASGIRNRMTSAKADVAVRKGCLIVIHALKT